MKKFSFLLFFIMAIKTVHADPGAIALSFSAEHDGTPVALDSIFIENLTQGASMMIYDDHVILTSGTTGFTGESPPDLFSLHVYPNPFMGKTTFEVFTPGRDYFNLEVFDLTGRRLASHEITLEQGHHQFTFFAGEQQSYVLAVGSGKFNQKRVMIQTGRGSSSFSRISYDGSFAKPKTEYAGSEVDFPYQHGDELRFTGYVTSNYGNKGSDVITDSPVSDAEYLFDVIFPLHTLSLSAEPMTAGTVHGCGEYEQNQDCIIEAVANEGFEFVGWAGHTDYLDDPDASSSTLTMPGYDLSITAVFEQKAFWYGDGVTDIDGNEYVTVIIGTQEWMAENLRVTKYSNGDVIPADLSDADWYHTTSGAYAVFPHEMVDGINSHEEMVAAYGKLYNWFAVDDTRGLCPPGWKVPNNDDWDQLKNFIIGMGHPNQDNNPAGAGNAMKSCRQVDSPLGGDCNTTEHPRWNPDDSHYGFDKFGFSALPAGRRIFAPTNYSGMATHSNFQSATEWDELHNYSCALWVGMGSAWENYHFKQVGNSVRCVREAFTTTWDTSLGVGNTVTLGLAGDVDATILWGDGNISKVTTAGPHTHDYGKDGIYTVYVTGNVTEYDGWGIPDRTKLISIDSWGNLGFTSMSDAFPQTYNLLSVPNNTKGLEYVTNMSGMFYYSSMNSDLSGWDMSGVTNMICMFQYSSFNQDIGNWDVSNVTSMMSMFSFSPFNQDISGWDLSNVENTQGMFWGNSDFNQDIGDWDVSNISNMRWMFEDAANFNQDIGGWDVSNVIMMASMFQNASSFNQDLSGWCVELIPNEPPNFDTGADSWVLPRPVWGTCP